MKTASKVFRFERHQLDLGRYELRRAGRRLPLSRLPMELLILLIERRGQLVTREEIVARLWPHPDSVDIVQGINTAVNRIRAVLNDDAGKPRFIETVVGKGYRFIADVEQMELTTVPAATEESAPPVTGSSEARQEHPFELIPALPAPPTLPVPPRRNWLLPAFALGIFLMGSLVTLWWRSRPTSPARTPVFSELTNNDSETPRHRRRHLTRRSLVGLRRYRWHLLACHAIRRHPRSPGTGELARGSSGVVPG